PDDKRVLSVEDTRELVIPHQNQVNYVVSRNEATPAVGYSHVIDHLMRSRPDIILAGELSIANTFPVLRLLNSGHKGFMCTLHANSPNLALDEAIPANVMLSGNPAQGVSEYLRKTVDVVIQLHRLPSGKREVTEVLFPITGEQQMLSHGLQCEKHQDNR
ncbi:MAG: ATPase, T2SS/T4P/T4SS family, partial [Pseudomonadota bacterium]